MCVYGGGGGGSRYEWLMQKLVPGFNEIPPSKVIRERGWFEAATKDLKYPLSN